METKKTLKICPFKHNSFSKHSHFALVAAHDENDQIVYNLEWILLCVKIKTKRKKKPPKLNWTESILQFWLWIVVVRVQIVWIGQ